MSIDKLREFANIATIAGVRVTSEIRTYAAEMLRNWEDGDNLRTVEAAARAGGSTAQKALRIARELEREFRADAERHAERAEIERQRAEAEKPKPKRSTKAASADVTEDSAPAD